MVRGRPREFDTEEALAKALRVFWERGFQATSITDLTAATGVGRTGLYAAFGDKESLFLLALDRYMALAYTDCAEMLEDEPDARRAVEAHLLRMADSVTKPDDAHSCMLMNTVQESAGTQFQGRRTSQATIFAYPGGRPGTVTTREGRRPIGAR